MQLPLTGTSFLTGPSLLTGISLLTLGGLLAAQSTTFGGNLVGNTGPDGLASSLAGYLYSQDIGKCSTAVRRGTSLRMALNGAGGTAYDAARQAVWLCDGSTIVLKDIGTGKESCKFNATLTNTKGAMVTGLAHSNRRRELIQLELFPTSTGSSVTLRFYDTRSCPPKLLTKTCTIALPRGNAAGTAGGLACDEVRDLIFFSSSLTGTAGTTNTIHHVPYAVLCLVPTTTFTLPSFGPCGGKTVNQVSGLAYDACSRILYATEGTVTLMMDLTNLSKPVNLNASKPCCKFGVTRQIWAGLAYVPRSTNGKVGSSCLAAGCGTCANLDFAIHGDLVLGNQDLALEVTGAPAGGNAALYLSLGQCQTPGLRLPGLCGAIHPAVTSGQPILLGSFALSAGTACTGALKLPTAVPTDPALCNTDLCAQFFVTCPSNQGVGLTNAVHFKVGG